MGEKVNLRARTIFLSNIMSMIVHQMNRDSHFIPWWFDPTYLPTPARNEAFYYRQSHFPPRTYQDKYTANTLCPCSSTTTDRKVSLMNKLSDLSPLPNATASSYHPPKVLQVFDNQSQFHGWCMVLRCFGSFFSFLFFLFFFSFLASSLPHA